MRTQKARMMLFAGAMAAVCLVAIGLAIRPLAGQDRASESITRPVVSEAVSPVDPIAPVAWDGHRGQGFLCKPPGAGPFPAVLVIHGGLVACPAAPLKEYMLTAPQPSRFLAAGYVVAVITYRSRDHDPQSTVSREDSLAAVDHLRHLSYVDPKSIVVFGCSGGGDLALEIAAATDVAAIVPEEPASVLLTGIFNKEFPKSGERYTPMDAAPISADPKRYYTAAHQAFTREKIGRIRCPILILQGDVQPINQFNAAVLIPELKAAGKNLDVITFAGEPHCFAFNGSGPGTPRPAAALKAFHDADTFFRRHLPTKPKPMDAGLVKLMPVPPG